MQQVRKHGAEQGMNRAWTGLPGTKTIAAGSRSLAFPICRIDARRTVNRAAASVAASCGVQLRTARSAARNGQGLNRTWTGVPATDCFAEPLAGAPSSDEPGETRI